ncbi:hypothetical protein INT44_007909 [Umbelopsis vinacea]|uniref:protein-tyrosine-phosphatase n=1 Tax=Umbelopsis vinacea TaxID=44442 RepID=A0A8H7UEX6_9FUNG|nr:hypothetical protein INT44_007909 [Umbelopsis vinacea]
MFFGRGKKKRHGESSTTASPPSRKPILQLADMLKRFGSPDVFDSSSHRSAKHMAEDRSTTGNKSSSFLSLLALKPRPSLSTPDLTLKARESIHKPHLQEDDPLPMPRVSTSTPASPSFNPQEKMNLKPLKSPTRPVSLDTKAANRSIPSTPRDPFSSPKLPGSPRIPRTPTRRISYQNDSSYLHKRSKSSSSITLPLAYSKRSSGGINLPVIVTAATEQKQTRQNSYPHIIPPRHPYPNHSNSSTPALPTSAPEPKVSRPASMNAMPDDPIPSYTDISSPRRASLFPPSANVSTGKVSKRPVLKLTTLNTNPHSSSGFVSLAIKRSLAIQPELLAKKLSQGQKPLLIDVRTLPDYQKLRIRGSLNVNLPTLLIKRYRRGTISNFNLESFITTPNGRQRYLKRLAAFGKDLESIREEDDYIVVFDDCMDEEDKTSHAWTLVGVLEKAILENSVSGSGERARILWLKGGYEAFEKYDQSKQHLVSGQQEDEEFEKADFGPDANDGSSDIDMSRLSLTPNGPMPRRSVSSTLGAISSINTSGFNQRRMSLFTLDTQATRSRRDFSLNLNRPLVQEENTTRRSDGDPSHTSDPPTAIPTELHRQQRLLHLLYDEDDSPRRGTAAGSPPVTDGEFSFIISEIIAGFLFVGPEIATLEQMQQLKDRKIRRILNMAEECDDDVPGLKEEFVYRKIAARDTVEMRNVERCLKEAVECIENAKHHHEPIYVHCKAGKSRSVTAVLAYLIQSERWTLRRAYRHVIKARPNMSPNIGFVAELMKIEGGVHGQVSNFAGSDWHANSMPSPELTRELRRLEREWERDDDDNVSNDIIQQEPSSTIIS